MAFALSGRHGIFRTEKKRSTKYNVRLLDWSDWMLRALTSGRRRLDTHPEINRTEAVPVALIDLALPVIVVVVYSHKATPRAGASSFLLLQSPNNPISSVQQLFNLDLAHRQGEPR